MKMQTNERTVKRKVAILSIDIFCSIDYHWLGVGPVGTRRLLRFVEPVSCRVLDRVDHLLNLRHVTT